MRLQIKGRNLTVKPDVEDYALEKLGKLERFLPETTQVELELSVEKNVQRYLPTFQVFMVPLGLLPLPTKWTLAVGEPVDLSEYGPEAADDRVLVNHLADEVRRRIQAMVDEALARRKSVLRG